MGATVMIVDAGGGTVDFSSYEFTGVEPLSVEEIAAADCEYGVSCVQCANVRNLSTKASLKARRVSMCEQRSFFMVRTTLADSMSV